MENSFGITSSIETYRLLCNFQLISSSTISNLTDITTLDKVTSTFIEIESNFLQKDPDRLQGNYILHAIRFFVQYFNKNSADQIIILQSSLPHESSISETWSVCSFTGALIARVQNVISDKGNGTQFLEIWDKQQGKVQTLRLSEESVPHGHIHEPDSTFASVEWSHGEDSVLYVAEAKRPPTKSLFEAFPPSGSPAASNSQSLDSPYAYAPHWGECMRDRRHTVLALYSLAARRVRLLVDLSDANAFSNSNSASSCAPECPDPVPDRVLRCVPDVAVGCAASVGQALFAPRDTGVVFVAWAEWPRLGVAYEFNRASALYYVHLRDLRVRRLGSHDAPCVRSPRFSPDGRTLVWLENLLLNGPHMQCSRLAMCLWPASDADLEAALEEPDATQLFRASTLVDVVEQPESPLSFPGLYLFAEALPRRCWTADSRYLLLHSQWRSALELLAVDVRERRVHRLTRCSSGNQRSSSSDEGGAERVSGTGTDDDRSRRFGAHRLLDVSGPFVLVASAAPDTPDTLRLGILEQRSDSDASISIARWHELFAPPTLATRIEWRLLEHKTSTFPFESILLTPRPRVQPTCGTPTPTSTPTPAALPLVLYIHGGPHSALASEFLCFPVGWALQGFAVLCINYRGTHGFGGQRGLLSLTCRAGEQDVADCLQALDEARSLLESESCDRNHCIRVSRVCLFGWSHGGLVVSWLLRARPRAFSAAAVRNPIVPSDATNTAYTDIPDWLCTELLGSRFHYGELLPRLARERFYALSPFVLVASASETSLESLDVARSRPSSHETTPAAADPPHPPPLLLLLGEADQIMQPSRGLAFYRQKRARHERVEAHFYPDGDHALSALPYEADSFITTSKWFLDSYAIENNTL